MTGLGTEWLIEATGCRAESLRDLTTLAKLFDCLIVELQLCPVAEPVWQQFPGEIGINHLDNQVLVRYYESELQR